MINARAIAADKLKQELNESMHSLLFGESNPLLLAALKAKYPDLVKAVVLTWIPEQAEDMYWVLVSRKQIAVAELTRIGNVSVEDVVIETQSVEEYRVSLSTTNMRRLTAALELMD